MIVALNFIALPDTQAAGAFRYIHNLLTIMGEYILHDTHFIVYKQRQISATYIGMPANADVEYIDVPTLGSGWKRILFEQTLFHQYLKPCDVFYSYCTSLPLFVHAKRVFTLHDIYYITNPERYGWAQRTYLTLITRLYAHRANEILTVSQYSQTQIERYIPSAKSKVTITYNVLPQNQLQEKKIELQSKPFFLYVGSLQPSKNIIRMIDGFEIFNKNGHYQLIIVGQPLREADYIINHIEQSANITYLGYRSDEEIAYLYKHTEAVVLLSLCEGFGIPPLEGFKYGKPALVANATSLPEVVGKAGIKVNPVDINDIANGFKLIIEQKEHLSAHAKEQIQKFDRHQACETWMNSLQIKYTK